jgi:hypothetical protein
VSARISVLETPNVQQPLGQVDLIPPQGYKFADPQGVSVSEKQHRAVTVTVPPLLFSSRDERFDLRFR